MFDFLSKLIFLMMVNAKYTCIAFEEIYLTDTKINH